MVAITQNEAKFYIQETLKELINKLKKTSVSPSSMNENGCGVMAGLENAEKILPRLDKDYLSSLSNAELQAFFDKCKRIARNFDLEHQRIIQPFAVLDGSGIMEIKASHKDYEKETYSLILHGGMQRVMFEYSIEPGVWDGMKERYVSWTLWEQEGGCWKQFEHDYLRKDLPQIFGRHCMLVFRNPGLYKVIAELFQYSKGRSNSLPTDAEILCHKEIDVSVMPCNYNKNDFSIVITRSCLETEYDDNPVFPMYYKSVLELKYKDFVCFSCPVQSVADYDKKYLSKNDYTLPMGKYNARLLTSSSSYINAIEIKSPDFLIHPNQITNEKIQKKRALNGQSNGPFAKPYSKGCQILEIQNFNSLIKMLHKFGFESNNKDFISVEIRK